MKLKVIQNCFFFFFGLHVPQHKQVFIICNAGVVTSAFEDFEYPDKVVQLQKLDDNTCVAELFQGPTLAFKDLSLAVLAKLLEIFLKKRVSSH